MIEAVVAPVLHKYVPPVASPVAVIVADDPLQIVALVALTVGTGFTVTVDVAVKEAHPFNV